MRWAPWDSRSYLGRRFSRVDIGYSTFSETHEQ